MTLPRHRTKILQRDYNSYNTGAFLATVRSFYELAAVCSNGTAFYFGSAIVLIR
ncbi:hypothetical protein H6F69_12375 [Leptolyngbya sp. FACHB-1624]|uniref:hypothetical protein n=1 Tax=Leptolyngbya sp. FACHB-1624 TaxID=2692802 RepID=UPI001688DA9D|nr:hypothetical protein [Leptolyngbya sp. FACHB-1624]MBD1856410.1 hypothetical protein [Leptolyngbya sp. FACHB-1624]